MPINEEDGMERPAPAPREMVELEASLKTIEENLREVNTNFKALRKNHLELSELKNMLTKTDGFLAENQFNQFQENGRGGAGASDETTGLLDGKFVPRPPSLSSSDPAPSAYVKDGTDQGASSSLKFNITAGVLDRSRMLAFETMLWRVSKGNVFIKFMDIEEKMVDPNSGDPLYKCVFLIFYQGEELRVRVKKICEGFHAAVFACPESRVERRDMLCGVGTRIEDLHTVLSQTTEHRHRYWWTISYKPLFSSSFNTFQPQVALGGSSEYPFPLRDGPKDEGDLPHSQPVQPEGRGQSAHWGVLDAGEFTTHYM